MNRPPRGLLSLLLAYARPFTGALLLVFGLNAVGALLQQGTYLLLQPTWTLLFAGQEVHGSERAQEILQDLQSAHPDPAVAEALAALGAQAAEPKAEQDAPGTLARARAWIDERLIGDRRTLSAERRLELLGLVALTIAVMALLAGAAGYLAAVTSARVGHQMVVALRQDLARHLTRLSLGFHGRRKFGDLMSRISADVGQTLQVTNLMLKDLVQEPLTALTALWWSWFVAPEATLMVLVGTPLLIVPVSLILKKVKKRSHKSQARLGASMQVLTQLLQGMRTVKAYRAEERELERFEQANQTWVKEAVRLARTTALSQVWTIVYTHAGLGVIVLLVGWLAVSGRMEQDPGEMLTFFMLISKSYGAIKHTTKALGTVAQSRGAAERLQALFDEPIEIAEDPRLPTIAGPLEGIHLLGVSFTYPGTEEPAIKDLELKIRPGETLAIVGPSGSGKSTLIDLLARFLDPTSGSILVAGQDLRAVSLESWTSQYAMVTQVPFLFHTSIEENIRYGRPGASLEEVRAAASAAGVLEFIDSLPSGLATDVEDAGARLSGGQRQRITIARAFLKGAPLLLLDEATSALDSESERLVQQALDRLIEGHTVVVIAHRLSTIRRADRIAVLDGGRLVELGGHEELLRRGGIYAHLWSLQEGGQLKV